MLNFIKSLFFGKKKTEVVEPVVEQVTIVAQPIPTQEETVKAEKKVKAKAVPAKKTPAKKKQQAKK